VCFQGFALGLNIALHYCVRFAVMRAKKTALVRRTKVMDALAKAYVRMRESKGQTMAEYALIVGLVAVVTVGVWTILGTDIQAIVSSINSTLAAA
jgi:Flp pilus assembly pilin Flp